MLFNSFQFLIFFPISVALYFSTPAKYRWTILLAASYYFYMSWRPEYAILILGSTIIDYFAALKMSKYQDKKKRTPILLFSLFTNLGLLFTFKYFNFFSESFYHILKQFSHSATPFELNVLLPVGISFYTFQTLSYTIDVYRGDREPERHFGIFAVYVSFFPQLVAGPIERSTTLLPQFHKTFEPNYNNMKYGLQLAAWGMFKKVAIADQLALYVNRVYSNPTGYTGFDILLATYFFAFQIYCDFSGYSDIAIGVARVFGYKFMKNFDRPYFSQSIHEFWKRWHISLSSWFRDYLYIPLGGNRVSKSRLHFNLLAVFLTSGLWHGANWTFVVWGGLHGLFLIFERWSHKAREKLYTISGIGKHTPIQKFINIIITFHLVLFSWVFFRAQSLQKVFLYFKEIAKSFIYFDPNKIFKDPINPLYFLVIILLIMVEILQSRYKLRETIAKFPTWLRWSIYFIGLFSIYYLGEFNEQEFIYFQF